MRAVAASTKSDRSRLAATSSAKPSRGPRGPRAKSPRPRWRIRGDRARRRAGYTGQSMASAVKAKIIEAPPMENRSRSDIACPLAAVIFDAPGNERVRRESRNARRARSWAGRRIARQKRPGTLGVSPPDGRVAYRGQTRLSVAGLSCKRLTRSRRSSIEQAPRRDTPFARRQTIDEPEGSAGFVGLTPLWCLWVSVSQIGHS